MTASRLERLRDVRLYLVASADGPAIAGRAEPFWRALREAADAGVGAIQLRLKDCATDVRRAALVHARSLLPQGVLLLVNDDLEALRDAGGELLADGVHLGREDAAALLRQARGPGEARGTDPNARPPPEAIAEGLRLARARLGDALLLGTSTRARDEIARALAAGADHVGFGAMAATSTKDGTTLADPDELAACVHAHPDTPIFAIGGLTPDTLHVVRDAGCRRAAIGAAILHARDVGAAVRACDEALGA